MTKIIVMTNWTIATTKRVKKNKKTNSNPHDFLNEDRGKTFRITLYLLAKSVDEFYLAGPNLNQDRFSKGMKRFLSLNQIVVKEINFEPNLANFS